MFKKTIQKLCLNLDIFECQILDFLCDLAKNNKDLLTIYAPCSAIIFNVLVLIYVSHMN